MTSIGTRNPLLINWRRVYIRDQATFAVRGRLDHRDAHHVHAPLLRTKWHSRPRVHRPWYARQPAKCSRLGRGEWNVPSLLGEVLELPRSSRRALQSWSLVQAESL